MKKIIAVLFVFFSILLTGCSSVKTESDLERNTSETGYHTYTLRNASSSSAVDPQVGSIFTEELNARLQQYGYEQGNEVIVSYDIKAYDPGNRALRMFVGFGAGKGTMEIVTSLTDKNGKILGSVTTQASLRMGFFGGSLNKIIRAAAVNTAKEIYRSRLIKK